MKSFLKVFIILSMSVFLFSCGNMYSYEDIEKIKEQAVEDAKEDILDQYALDYVRENYTPEELYPDKIIQNRNKKAVYSNIHGQLPENSDPYAGYYIINKRSKIFHHSDCDSVKNMKEENKIASNRTKDELIEQGYEPCGAESW